MYCPRCGEDNADDNRFCTECGTELRSPGQAGDPARKEDTDASENPARVGFLQRVLGSSRRERQVTAATLLAIVVAIVAFILLDAPEDDSSSDPFLRASDQRCLIAKRDVERVSDRTLGSGKPNARQQYIDGLLEVVLEWRTDQSNLQPAADQRQAADDYLAALLDLSAALGRLSEAGPAQLVPAAEQTDASTAALEQQIDDLGLERCGALTFRQDAGTP